VNQPYADEVVSHLVDLTGIFLDELPTYDRATLAPTMDKLLRRVDDPDSITSGYNPQRLD
jgi:hypothetical protein